MVRLPCTPVQEGVPTFTRNKPGPPTVSLHIAPLHNLNAQGCMQGASWQLANKHVGT